MYVAGRGKVVAKSCGVVFVSGEAFWEWGTWMVYVGCVDSCKEAYPAGSVN